MNTLRTATLTLLAAFTFIAVSSAVPASANVLAPGKLTVSITNTGTQWGKVKVSSINKTCAKASCSYKVKVGTKLTLTEKATDSSTWPFCGWTLNGKSKGTASKLSFKMGSKDKVSVTYGAGSCNG